MTTTTSRREALRGRSVRESTAGRAHAPVRDRFDDVPETSGRVGAHRGRRPRGRGWIVVAWAALAAGILTGAGVLALAPSFPKSASIPAATGGGTAAKVAAPVTDPKQVDQSLNLQITVLNASPDANADTTVGDRLAADGWPINGTADASVRNAKSTVVYYSSNRLEGVARGLVKILGTGQVQLSDAFPGAPVTVVLGSDYAR